MYLLVLGILVFGVLGSFVGLFVVLFGFCDVTFVEVWVLSGFG